MLAALRRHPFPIEAFFRYSLVLTYAFPEELLEPLLPPGLTLDGHEGNGFVAIALVQTQDLRPAGFPRVLGRSFFLAGYRIFSRLRRDDGKVLRGLRILRSDADSRIMVALGSLLTHYRYRFTRVRVRRDDGSLEIQIRTRDAEADLDVHADLRAAVHAPPAGSPFADLTAARHFAGPLPHTFDYEAETDGIVVVRGVRRHWEPRPVSVEVSRCTFFDRAPFRDAPARLANAFLVEDVPYRWERGRRVAVPRGTP